MTGSLAVSLLLILTSVSIAQSARGMIRGTVLADDATPVAGAHVSADVMRGDMWITSIDAQTDDAGQFVFSGLAFGEYRLSAQKGEAGYLSTRTDILDCRQEQRVMLTDDEPSASAVIRFAPKAGTLIVRFKDAKTGALISAHLSWASYANPEGGWGTAGHVGKDDLRVLFPSNTPIRLGACSEGYAKWVYADASKPSRPVALTLAPGTERFIEIQLQPSSDLENQVCAFSTF